MQTHTPKNQVIPVNGNALSFPILNTSHQNTNGYESIHVLASGPSINQTDFSEITKQPCLTVNGAICLTTKHQFSHFLGLVVTDPRFIKHNLNELKQHFNHGYFYMTQAVLYALIEADKNFVLTHYQKFILIFDALKPINLDKNNKTSQISIFNKITEKLFNKKHRQKKQRWHDLTTNANFIISQTTQGKYIGASLDITQGFIEAGTVAYVATQLAYFLNTKNIVIHGMDLINANEPRFYENKKNTAPSMLSKAVENRIIPSFDLLANAYTQKGVKVLNGSPVSKDLFKSIAYINLT